MANESAFSVDEMARRTGLSRAYLYEQIKDGKLVSLKVGKRRLVRVEDEAAFLEAHRAPAAALC